MKRFGQRRRYQVPVHVLCTVAMAALIAGCRAKRENSGDGSSSLPVVKVKVQTAKPELQTAIEEVVGTVRARTRATLEAKVSGRIDKLPVVLGQRVKAGDLLASLDAAEIAARLDQANASLEEADQDWKRISGLFEQQAVTHAEYDVANARYHEAQAGVAEAKAMMSYVNVLAPFDGVVTKKWVDAGDQASPGKPLVSIEDPSALELEADVPEGIAANIHKDDQLTCRIGAVNAELTGTVTEMAPAADPVSRTFQVKLELPQREGLMSGQFARLEVPIGRSESLCVPASAVVERGQLEIVFVVTDQHAQMRLVKSGRRTGDQLEILSGLAAGDAVVVEGAAQLTDGQPVEAR